MREHDPDIVTASEIADWAWCPEAWRLRSMGHASGNQAALQKGEKHHTRKAVFEERSRSAITFGWWLVVAAVLMAAVGFVLGKV